MSANIPDTKLVSELLKPTGFNCPEGLKDKTFDEAISGGGMELIDLEVTSNGEYEPEEGQAFKKVTANVPGTKYYAWARSNGITMYTDFAVAPESVSGYICLLGKVRTVSNYTNLLRKGSLTSTYAKQTDTLIKYNGVDWTRSIDKDITIW